MGSLYRRTSAKKIPARAKVFTKDGVRVASWKGSDGKTRTVEVKTRPDGTEYLLVPASTYTVKYRDAKGVLREISTDCREEVAARRVLGDKERQVELVKSGVVSSEEEKVGAEQARPLQEYINAFLEHWKAKSVSVGRIKTTKARLEAVSRTLYAEL